MDGAGVAPSEIRVAEDLSRIPITDRGALADQPTQATLATGLDPRRLVTVRTSGSTGEPLVIQRNRVEQLRWNLSWGLDLWHHGLRPADRVARIVGVRGAPQSSQFVRALQSLGIFVTVPLRSSLQPEEIVDRLESYQPDVIRGFAGPLCQAAELAISMKKSTIRPRLVWVVGEVVTPSMRSTLHEAFRATVREAYGCREVGLIGTQCPESLRLHIDRPNLIVEVLRQGSAAAQGESGDIVVSWITAHSQPFLRYRLGDSVTRGPVGCSCGFPGWTLERVDGRLVDIFRLPDGRSFHPWNLTVRLLEDSSWLRRFQFVQERLDLIRLKVIHDGSPSARYGEARCHQRLQALLGPEVRLVVDRVDAIPLGPSGKGQTLVSHL